MDRDTPLSPEHESERIVIAPEDFGAANGDSWDSQNPAQPRGAAFRLSVPKLGIVLALAGWISFLYFATDNIPVSSFRLGAALPAPPQGWRRSLTQVDHPSRVSIVGDITKFTSSTASRAYTQAGKQVSLEIWDWAGDYPYHLPIDIPGWMNGEAVRIGAEDGRLRYNSDTKGGRLRARYLNRFYLIVEGEGIERHELQSWYHRIDLAALRRDLDQLRSQAASR